MAEVTRTMSEWIELDRKERKLRAEVRRLMALCNQPKKPPVVLASARPATRRAVAPAKFDPEKLPPAEMPAEPSLADIAKQLGVSLEELRQASGSMSLERLMTLLGVSTPDQLLESLQLIIGNQPKGLTRFERVRAAVAKIRLSGRRVGQLMAMERAKAARAAALNKHRAAFKRR